MTLAIFHSPAEWSARFGAGGKRTVVTVGNFDGVHRGHQEILRRVAERARAEGALAAVVTFDPHPLRVLRPADAPQMLLTVAQRLAAFDAAKMDAALVLKFDAALAQLSAEDFVRQILVETLRANAILVGETFRFGHRQAGNVALLRKFGATWNFAVECIEPVVCRGIVVSSTTIRNAVREGNLLLAGRLLGRPYALSGEIRTGTGQGRELVVPTLNLQTEQELLPKTGVYATEAVVDGRTYRAVTNVGVRPTFGGKGVTVESYLFDFEREMKHGPLAVRFWARLRDEMKFSGPEALRAQILRDAARAQQFFRLLNRPNLRKQSA
ncbi:MAG: bifunctional riboflavin kinase/FAD synthetase [Candidatus Acidiferrales bacterium]